jgi:hypothetical protein
MLSSYPVVQSPSSNATIVVIDIIPVGGGGSSIVGAIAVAFNVTVNFTASTIAVVAIIVDVALSTLLCHHRHCHAPWQPIGGAGPNHATETFSLARGWRPYPWIGHVGAGGIDMKTLFS